MTSLDWLMVLRAVGLIVLGLTALAVAAVQGWWEAAGLGVISLLLGGGGLAFTMWEVRHPPRRLRPGYFTGDRTVHHLVALNPSGEPEWEPGPVARALCGAEVSSVELNCRPSKAAGEPCWPCIMVLRRLRDEGR